MHKQTQNTRRTFQKYISRIAKDLDMPCDTASKQKRVFDALLELKRFTRQGGQPKVSNWYAWNGMAKHQIREPNATKCVFAAVYVDDPDPDDDGPSTSLARTRSHNFRLDWKVAVALRSRSNSWRPIGSVA